VTVAGASWSTAYARPPRRRTGRASRRRLLRPWPRDDNRVEPAEALGRRVDERVDGLAVGHVGRDGERVDAGGLTVGRDRRQ